jgi:hypothetical protein
VINSLSGFREWAGVVHHIMAGSDHIFLSYHHADGMFALRLAADLKNEGLRLSTDQQAGGLDNARAMLTVLSPQYLRDCQIELSYAAEFARPLLPVLLQPVDDLPSLLQKNDAVDFSRWPDEPTYTRQFQQLLARLRRQFGDLFDPPPGAEIRYVNSLIARLSGYRGVLQYVELAAQADSADTNLADELESQFTEIAAESDQPDSSTSIHEVAARFPRVVLLGEPGAGKTTSLYRLIVESAAVPHLLEALRDSNAWVRGLAARALGQTADQRALDPLNNLLSDTETLVGSDLRVRDFARWALDQLEG